MLRVLVVVQGGIAEAFQQEGVEVRIVDLDNQNAGDPIEVLPEGVGYEALVEEAKLNAGEDVLFEKETEL